MGRFDDLWSWKEEFTGKDDVDGMVRRCHWLRNKTYNLRKIEFKMVPYKHVSPFPRFRSFKLETKKLNLTAEWSNYILP